MSSVVDVHKKKGKRPHYDVYIGRAVRYTGFIIDSKWSNPSFFNKDLEFYERFIRKNFYNDLHELQGKVLGCWCVTTDELEPLVCHGQVLMKLVRELENKEV